MTHALYLCVEYSMNLRCTVWIPLLSRRRGYVYTIRNMVWYINPISTYVENALRHMTSTRLDKDTCNNLTLRKTHTYERSTINSNMHPVITYRTCNNIPSSTAQHMTPTNHQNYNHKLIVKNTHNLIS